MASPRSSKPFAGFGNPSASRARLLIYGAGSGLLSIRDDYPQFSVGARELAVCPPIELRQPTRDDIRDPRLEQHIVSSAPVIYSGPVKPSREKEHVDCTIVISCAVQGLASPRFDSKPPFWIDGGEFRQADGGRRLLENRGDDRPRLRLEFTDTHVWMCFRHSTNRTFEANGVVDVAPEVLDNATTTECPIKLPHRVGVRHEIDLWVIRHAVAFARHNPRARS